MATERTAELEEGQDGSADFEKELAAYLQERLKPGMSRSTIPLVARSIAKEIARMDACRPENGGAEEPEADTEPELTEAKDAEVADEADEDQNAEAEEPEGDEEEPEAEGSGENGDRPIPDFEADMHELQGEFGDDWILRFSVHGDDGWLTAEKQDASQHVEAATADQLIRIVEAVDGPDEEG